MNLKPMPSIGKRTIDFMACEISQISEKKELLGEFPKQYYKVQKIMKKRTVGLLMKISDNKIIDNFVFQEVKNV